MGFDAPTQTSTSPNGAQSADGADSSNENQTNNQQPDARTDLSLEATDPASESSFNTTPESAQSPPPVPELYLYDDQGNPIVIGGFPFPGKVDAANPFSSNTPSFGYYPFSTDVLSWGTPVQPGQPGQPGQAGPGQMPGDTYSTPRVSPGDNGNGTKPVDNPPSHLSPPEEVPAEAAPPPPKLTPETVKQYAEELHKAINRSGGFLGTGHDADEEKIRNLLDNLTAADRRAIEEAYANVDGNSDHRSLRTELKDRLDGDDWRKMEAILNRTDGRTNDAGNLMVALSAINDDRGDAERRVLETFATLNSDQMKLLEEDFQKHYGMSIDKALEEFDVSDDTMRAIDFMRKPIDQRTAQDVEDFARFAVDKGNLDFFAVALRGDTPAVREAREKLSNDKDFEKLVIEKFKPHEDGGALGFLKDMADFALGPLDEVVGGIINGDLSWGTVVGGLPIVEQFNDIAQAVGTKEENINLLSALDILHEGRVSLATIAINNTGSMFGWFDNKDNIKLAAENATDNEREAFRMGKEIADSGRQPANKQEENALEFYNRVHKAFEDCGEGHETAQWEDQLLTGGSIIGALAEADGGNDRFTAMEQLSQSDWQKLKDPESGPQFREQIEEYLNKFCDEDERTRLLDMLDKKVQAETFEDSQKVHRTLFETIEQNEGHDFLIFGTDFDGSKIIPAIADLSPEEAQRYKSDAQFRSKVDEFVTDQLDGPERAYARSLLSQVAETGKPPEESATDKILANSVNDIEPKVALADIEAALQDEGLRRRLSGNPEQMSEGDREILNAIEKTIAKAATESGVMFRRGGYDGASPMIVDEYTKPLLETGRLPLEMKAELKLKTRNFYEEAANASGDAVQKLVDSGLVSAAEQQLISEMKKNGGEMSLADEIRAMVLGSGDSYQDFKEPLSQLTGAQKQELREQYAKYGNLDDDFMSKVEDNDRNIYRTLLTATNVDGRQDFYDNLERALRSESGISPDGTILTLERSLTDQAAMLSDFQARFEQLPPEKQELANRYFAEALVDYQESKKAFAEKLYNIAVLVGGLAVGIATGGVALPALLAVAAVAAAGRVAMMRAIQGEDYEMTLSNVLKDAAIGAVTGGLSVIGPETIASLKGIGMVASARFATIGGEAVTQGLRQGGSRIIAKELDGLIAHSLVRGEAISEEALLNVCRKAAAEGVDPRTLLPALRAATEQSGREVIEGTIQSTLSANIREAGSWALIGGGSNVGIEASVGIANGNLDISHLPSAFLTGAVTGGGMAVAFKTVGAVAKPMVAHFRQAPDGGLHISAEPGENLTFEARLADGSTTTVHVDENGVTLPDGVQALEVPGAKVEDVTVTAEDVTARDPNNPRGGNFQPDSGLTPGQIDKTKPVADVPKDVTPNNPDTPGTAPDTPGTAPDTPGTDPNTPINPGTASGADTPPHIPEWPTAPVLTPTPDGNPIVRTDNGGRITEVVHPNGEVTKFGYKPAGILRRQQLREVELPDGLKVHYENGNWVDVNGKDMGWKDVRVQQDGTLTYRHADETRFIHRPDGSREIHSGDSVAYFNPRQHYPREIVDNVTGSKLVSQFDESGQFVGIKALERDSSGALIEDPTRSFIKDEYGWMRVSDGQPMGLKATPNPDGTIRFEGTIKTPEGEIASLAGKELNAGTVLHVDVNQDGTRMLNLKDGAAIIQDVDGRVVGWRASKKGTEASFRFDERGQLEQVIFRDGVIERRSDGFWYKGDTLVARNVGLSPNGEFLWMQPLDGNVSIFPGRETAAVFYRPDTAPLANWQPRVAADRTGLPTQHVPTSEEMLNARKLRELEPSEAGEPRFQTTRGTMTKRTDGTWIEQDINGTTRIFNAEGHLQSTVDTNGWTHSYKWNFEGQIERVEMTVEGKARAVERTADGRWEFVNEDGSRQAATIDLGNGPEAVHSVHVDSDGSITYMTENFQGMRYGMDGVNAKIDPVGREYISGRPEVIKLQRERLESLRDSMFASPQRRQRFDDMLKEFEERMLNRGGDPEAANAEIANTYYQLNKLLTADTAVVSLARRQAMAEELLYNAIHPESIDQGVYNTCNVTAEVEKRMFARQPSEAIRMVTEVATTGRYITADGLVVDMRTMQGAFEPHGSAKLVDRPEVAADGTVIPIKVDGQRHFSDQIFQQTSVNAFWQGQAGDQFWGFTRSARRASNLDDLRAGAEYQPGDIRYELVAPESPKDTGERLFDYTTNPPTRVKKAEATTIVDPITGQSVEASQFINNADTPYLFNEQINSISKILTGEAEVPHYFVRDAKMNGAKDGILYTNSIESFQQQLQEMRRSGNLPATAYVDARQPLFANITGTWSREYGAHVINIQDAFQDASGRWMVRFTNQWGSRSNKTVPLDDLFRAMKPLPNGTSFSNKVARLRERWFPSGKERPHSATGDDTIVANPPESNSRDIPNGGDPLNPGRPSQTDSLLPERALQRVNAAIRERNADFIRSVRADLRGGYELQVKVLDLAQKRLQQLQDNGTISRDWLLIPTRIHSAADASGVDAVLYNHITGEIRTIDVTGNAGKVDGTGKRVSEINRAGLLEADSRYFDERGNLLTDPRDVRDVTLSNGKDPHTAIMQFDADLTDHLVNLTSTPGPLTVRELPLHTILSPDETVKIGELEQIERAVREKARTETDPTRRAELLDFAGGVHSAWVYSTSHARQQLSPVLNDYIATQADNALVEIAASRLTSTRITINSNGTSNVRYINDGQLKLEASDGSLYDGGSVEGLLAKRKLALSDAKTLREFLSSPRGERRLKDLRRQLPGKSDEEIITLLSSAIGKVEVRWGARVSGANRPGGEPHPADMLLNKLKGGAWEARVRPEEAPPAVVPETTNPATPDQSITTQPDLLSDPNAGSLAQHFAPYKLGDVPGLQSNTADADVLGWLREVEAAIQGDLQPAELQLLRNVIARYEQGDTDALEMVRQLLG